MSFSGVASYTKDAVISKRKDSIKDHDKIDDSSTDELDIPDELRCVICQELYYLPTTIVECQHNFCSLCIRQCFVNQSKQVSVSMRHRSQKRYCPICRTLVNDMTSDCSKSLQPNHQIQIRIAAFQKQQQRDDELKKKKGHGEDDHDVHCSSSWATSLYYTSNNNTSRQQPKQQREPLQPIKLPIQLDHKKPSELRALCREHQLDAHGSDTELRDRLRLFALFWNAHCTTSNNNNTRNNSYSTIEQVDPNEIRRIFQRREHEKVIAARRDARSGIAQHKSYVNALLEQQNQKQPQPQQQQPSNSDTTATSRRTSSVTASASAPKPSKPSRSVSPTLEAKWKSGFVTLISDGLERLGKTAEELRSKRDNLRRKWVDQYGSCANSSPSSPSPPSTEDVKVDDSNEDNCDNGNDDSCDDKNNTSSRHDTRDAKDHAPPTTIDTSVDVASSLDQHSPAASSMDPIADLSFLSPEIGASSSSSQPFGGVAFTPVVDSTNVDTNPTNATMPSEAFSSSSPPPLSSSPPKKRKCPPSDEAEIGNEQGNGEIQSLIVQPPQAQPLQAESTMPTSDPSVVRDGNNSSVSASSTSTATAGTAHSVANRPITAIHERKCTTENRRCMVGRDRRNNTSVSGRSNVVARDRRTSNISGVWDCPQCTFRNCLNTSSRAWCQMCCLKRHSAEYHQKLRVLEAEEAAQALAASSEPQHHAPVEVDATAGFTRNDLVDLTGE